METDGRAAQPMVWLGLIVGAAFLGWRGYGGLEETRGLASPASTTAAATAYRNFACLDDAMHVLVPAGSKVFVEMDGLLSLAALSAAFPHREVVGAPAEADVVFKQADPTNPDVCHGDSFEVSRPPKTF